MPTSPPVTAAELRALNETASTLLAAGVPIVSYERAYGRPVLVILIADWDRAVAALAPLAPRPLDGCPGIDTPDGTYREAVVSGVVLGAWRVAPRVTDDGVATWGARC